MIRVSYLSTLSLVLFSLTACQPPASEEPSESMSESEMAEPAGLSAEDLAAHEATTQAWVNAVLAGDFAAVAATYTEDAVMMAPNSEAIVGRAAIQTFFESFPPISSMELLATEVEGVGDLAYVRGSYTMTVAPEGADPISDTGKYIEIRRKQADGTWLLSRDLYNSDLPLPE